MNNDRTVPAEPDGAEVRAQRTAALKFALMGLSGASIEWYDFFLYATAAALVFPTIFFPATLSPLIALIASFSTFAVGFVARPVGALVFGHMGDRVGRKTAFAVALIMMGAATTLIGLLPSYRTAGFFAPLALVLLRVTQGLAVGGQWGGATLLATENAPNSRRGLYGGIAQAGVPVGVVLANLALLAANGAMSPEAFVAYGWRIPFLLSVALVGLGLFIHVRIEDTAAFRQLQQLKPSPVDPSAGDARLQASACTTTSMRAQRSPIFEALRRYPRLILVAAGAYVSATLSFYILITYVVAYGTSVAGLQLARSTMLTAVLIANVARVPVDILAGSLSDHYGRRRIFMTGVALTGVWAFILFPLIETRSLLWITVAICVGSCLVSLMYGPLAAMFTELFSTRVRYSAVSLAFQTGAIVGGGLAPIIATGLYARYHSNIWISVYIASACVMSLVCASTLKETHKIDLNEHVEPTMAELVHT
ncbi:MAG TPA: MFS transporter [Steroidobacteraceae bacterium]|nr:MFS transporter [Steroidobacteraceae bacterium]